MASSASSSAAASAAPSAAAGPATTAPLRTTATKLFDQAKQNAYVQFGVSKLSALSTSLLKSAPESVNAALSQARERATPAASDALAFLDRKVTAVDERLASAMTLAHTYTLQAHAKKDEAQQVVHSNLSALRQRLASERAARSGQVLSAAARLQQAASSVVATSPLLSQTISSTEHTIKHAIDVAQDKWKQALNTSQATIDKVLPDQPAAAAAEQAAAAAPATLSSLSSTVSRRVRARARAVVSASMTSMNAVQQSVRSRLLDAPNVIATNLHLNLHLKLDSQQLAALAKSLPLASRLDAQQLQHLLTSLPQQLQLHSSHVRSLAASRAAALQQRANASTEMLRSTMQSGASAVQHLRQQVEKDGVVSTVKSLRAMAEKNAIEPAVTLVSANISNVRGLVFAKLQVAVDWGKAHAKYFNITMPIALRQPQPQPAPSAPASA